MAYLYKRAALSRSRMQYGPGAWCVRSVTSIITLLGTLLLPVDLRAETGVHVSTEKPCHIEARKKIMITIKKRGKGSFVEGEIGLLWTRRNAILPVKYISQDRPIPRESRSSLTRIRCSRDKQESFDACLLARREKTRLRNFEVAVHRERMCVQCR